MSTMTVENRAKYIKRMRTAIKLNFVGVHDDVHKRAVIIVEERGRPAVETFEAFSEALKDAKLDAEDVDVGIVHAVGLEFVKTLPETVATEENMLLITDLLSVAMLKRMEATNTIAKNKKDAMLESTDEYQDATHKSVRITAQYGQMMSLKSLFKMRRDFRSEAQSNLQKVGSALTTKAAAEAANLELLEKLEAEKKKNEALQKKIADDATQNTSVLRDMTNTVRTKAASLWSWTTRY
jgi:hypothetical protein